MKRATLSLTLVTLIGCGGAKDRDVATGMNRETSALASVERDGLTAYVGALNHDAAVVSAQVSIELAHYRYALLTGDLDGADAALDQVMRARAPASPVTDVREAAAAVSEPAPVDVESTAVADAHDHTPAAPVIDEPAAIEEVAILLNDDEPMPASLSSADEAVAVEDLATAEPMSGPQLPEPEAPALEMAAEPAASPAASGGSKVDRPAWQRKGRGSWAMPASLTEDPALIEEAALPLNEDEAMPASLSSADEAVVVEDLAPAEPMSGPQLPEPEAPALEMAAEPAVSPESSPEPSPAASGGRKVDRPAWQRKGAARE